MEEQSAFMDKASVPTGTELKNKLNATYPYWQELEAFVLMEYAAGKKDWNFPGEKYGWSYRISDKRRVILYFLPRDGYFKIAMVFGQKAFDRIMRENISDEIKEDLRQARKYAEGRGIQISVKEESPLNDIKQLVKIKLNT